MTRAAFSAKAFALYLFVLGPVLVIAPNALLTLFQIAPTYEVWIRILGALVINIGILTWVAATYDYQHILAATVWSRGLLFVLLAAFVMLGYAPPVLLIFGVIDLLAGLWTHAALRADAAHQ